MRTQPEVSALAAALFGKTRLAILSLLYTHVDEAFYLRQIVRASGASLGAVPRELKILTDAGIITREVKGQQVYFQANRKCPIFMELKNIIIKTAGVADVLRFALKAISGRIRVAFIYGSFARGDETSSSDLDVMIIGDVKSREVISALRPFYETLGREINPTVYPPEEFRAKYSAGNHFIKNVILNPKVFIIGNDREIRKLAK
jgi:DNA-binding transcriptional ArsR family regulator